MVTKYYGVVGVGVFFAVDTSCEHVLSNVFCQRDH